MVKKCQNSALKSDQFRVQIDRDFEPIMRQLNEIILKHAHFKSVFTHWKKLITQQWFILCLPVIVYNIDLFWKVQLLFENCSIHIIQYYYVDALKLETLSTCYWARWIVACIKKRYPIKLLFLIALYVTCMFFFSLITCLLLYYYNGY